MNYYKNLIYEKRLQIYEYAYEIRDYFQIFILEHLGP